MGATETAPEAEAGSETPAPFLATRPKEERLDALLAFALAAEAGQPATPGVIVARGEEASRLLTEHAYRLLHNHLGEIRREAVAEHMAALRPPLGFWGVSAACLAACAVFGAGALWLIAHPTSLAALVSLLGG